MLSADIKIVIYIAIVLALLLVGIIIYLIVVVSKYRRRANQLRKLQTRSEIATLEKERVRIAADLHDELGPVLSVAKLLINTMEVKPADQPCLDKANELIDNIMLRIRDISNDLVPRVLGRKGIIAALEEFIRNISGKSSFNIIFKHNEINNEISHIPENVSIHLYRTVLEIINNTIKHSKGTFLEIEMATKKNKLLLATRDDGIGFDISSEKTKQTGAGFLNMLARMEMIGGEINIESSRVKGTKYFIEVPLN